MAWRPRKPIELKIVTGTLQTTRANPNEPKHANWPHPAVPNDQFLGLPPRRDLRGDGLRLHADHAGPHLTLNGAR